MEFIKAFFLFIFFISVMGIVLFALAYVVYVFYLSLFALKRRIKKETPYYIKPLKPTVKFIKKVMFLYVFVCLFFYASRANIYLFKDRAYKEAKAYAIAGEYLQLYQVIIGNYKTVDTFYYKALQYLQRELTLKNIYRLIPESDAEREIWNYKFQQYIYARSFWGPVVEENIRKNFGLLHPFASFYPEMKILINNIYNPIIALDTLPMKDKIFDKIDRYMVIASMAPYYSQYHTKELNQEYKKSTQTNTEFFKTPYYIEKFDKFVKAVDNTKYAMENDQELYKEFDNTPSIKVLLYWAGIEAYSKKVSADYRDNIYICETSNLDKFVEYQDEFLSWTNEPKSSFRKMSAKAQKMYKFVTHQMFLDYTAKYICGKKFNNFSWEEEGRIQARNITNLEDLEKAMKEMYEFWSQGNSTKFARVVEEQKAEREKQNIQRE